MAQLLDYQVYPEEYFSGCDVSVYFGDMWVDEIVQMNFTLMEYVQPIFGYNSYVYDACSRGSRLIQGNFRINFRESFYLHKIITDNALSGANSAWNTFAAQRLPADEYILWEKGNYASDLLGITEGTANVGTNYEGLSTKELKEKLKTKDPNEILQIAKYLQERHWSRDKQSLNTGGNPNAPFFYQGRNGFGIVVVYGSSTQSLTNITELNRRFDISPSTSYFLSGVQLQSLGHVVAPDGQPVYEDYTFIAKDLVPRS